MPGQDFDIFVHPWVSLVANDVRFSWAVFPDEFLKGSHVCVIDPARSLHLNGDLPPAQDKIHFQAGFRSPEINVVVKPFVGSMRKDLHQDKMFEGSSELFSPLLRDEALGDGTSDSDIEQVEFTGLCNHLAILPSFVWLDHRAQQCVHKDLVIFFDRLRIDTAVPGNVRIIRQFAVGVPHRIEEP